MFFLVFKCRLCFLLPASRSNLLDSEAAQGSSARCKLWMSSTPTTPSIHPVFKGHFNKKKQLPAGVFQAEEGEPKVLLGLKHTQSDFGGARVLRSIIPPVCAQRFSTSQVFGLLTDVCPDSPRAWSVCYPCTVKNLTASRKKCAVLTEADRRLMQSLWSDAWGEPTTTTARRNRQNN